MTRRSFSLLDRASSLACRCGIQMDQVFCGDNGFPLAATSVDGCREMSFLPNIILKPSREQHVAGARLTLDEVPHDLLATASRNTETRWICIREMKCGISRYYVSEAMERDVASWDLVQETWKANKIEVNALWMPEGEKSKFSRGFNQQIAIHKEPYTEPKPTCIKETKIRLKDGNEVEVECGLCLKVENLDKAFLSIEYYAREPQEAVSTSTNKQPDSELFADMSFLDSMMDELDATGELDALMEGFDF